MARTENDLTYHRTTRSVDARGLHLDAHRAPCCPLVREVTRGAGCHRGGWYLKGVGPPSDSCLDGVRSGRHERGLGGIACAVDGPVVPRAQFAAVLLDGLMGTAPRAHLRYAVGARDRGGADVGIAAARTDVAGVLHPPRIREDAPPALIHPDSARPSRHPTAPGQAWAESWSSSAADPSLALHCFPGVARLPSHVSGCA
jgi:hypothetical protein